MTPPLRVRSVLGCAAAFLLVTPHVAHSAWPRSLYSTGAQVMPGQNQNLPLCAVPDGTGGTFVLMYDVRSDAGDLYLQRITSQGDVAPGWPTSGVAVCTAAGRQLAQAMFDGFSMTADGAGGVLIAWVDERGGASNPDIYAQRITSAGTIASGWPVNGLAVSTNPKVEFVPQITSDGAGGAFIAWDFLYAPGDVDIYGAHVTGAGAVAWNLALYNPGGVQKDVRIAPGGFGTFFVAYVDSLPFPQGQQLRASHYQASGSPIAHNMPVCNASAHQKAMEIVEDGLGGLYAVWEDDRNGNTDIYASHLHLFVEPSAGWLADGNPVCTFPGNRYRPTIVRDNANGALIAWEDLRNGLDYDVYMQRMTLGGGPPYPWPINGIAVATAPNHQQITLLVSDGAGGGIVTWADERSAYDSGQEDTYVLRVMGNASVAPHWPFGGAPVAIAPGVQRPLAIAPDTLGGAISIWVDGLVSRAQRIDRFGALGNAEPDITQVTDVPNDQGGRLRLTWKASYLDTAPGYDISEYWVWRSTTLAAAQQAVAAGGRWIEERAATPAASAGLSLRHVRQFRRTLTNGVSYAWEFIAAQPAAARPQYSFTAETLVDDSPSSDPYTSFLIEARATGAASWDSAPDSGLSVDDLGPSAPVPFTGEPSGGNTQLQWGASPEPDVVAYRLHRGAGAGFTPGSGNLVIETALLSYLDATSGNDYKVAAVDAHGNLSPYSFVHPIGGTTNLPIPRMPTELALRAVSPNPARDGTSFFYDLPADGRVSLVVHDANGRRVRTLVAESVNAGEHRVAWDGRDQTGYPAAPGLYTVTLDAGGRTLRRRFAFLK